MDRRRFLLTSLVGALAAPLAAEAQSASRVGMLIPITRADAEINIEAFRQGLRELGYVEGRDIRIEPRYSEGRVASLFRRCYRCGSG
jgi:putative ABC transport system substrate-binding protein